MTPPQQDARATARENWMPPESATMIARDLTVALIAHGVQSSMLTPDNVGRAYATILDYVTNPPAPLARRA